MLPATNDTHLTPLGNLSKRQKRSDIFVHISLSAKMPHHSSILPRACPVGRHRLQRNAWRVHSPSKWSSHTIKWWHGCARTFMLWLCNKPPSSSMVVARNDSMDNAPWSEMAQPCWTSSPDKTGNHHDKRQQHCLPTHIISIHQLIVPTRSLALTWLTVWSPQALCHNWIHWLAFHVWNHYNHLLTYRPFITSMLWCSIHWHPLSISSDLPVHYRCCLVSL